MSTDSKLTIGLQYASPSIDKSINTIASAALIKKWVKASTKSNGTLTLRFVNAAEGKKLNRAFRNKDYATNVLTFPYERSRSFVEADIIFCLPVIQKEAKEQGKLPKAHLAHLVVHGCLHAQGYDHEVSKEAKKMESLETAILQKLGFANPYLTQ
jgi:probable rRNA maturation factor